VTNVADGLLDSQVIIDFVSEQPLSVSVSSTTVCPNESVVFQAKGGSADSAIWANGGSPASGSGSTFTTRFTTGGDFAVQTTSGGNSSQVVTTSVHVTQASGTSFVTAEDQSTDNLAAPFKDNAIAFLAALSAAGANVSIGSTYRSPERAYLMHYAWLVGHGTQDPTTVPAMDGVDICWLHRDAEGNPDTAGSVGAAKQMYVAFHMAHPAVLQSRHTEGLAIDMTINWTGDLTITGADGKEVTIDSTPRTGDGNTDLQKVGSGFGVQKLTTDAPHWSDDGH
jgi:hypothetical protein